MAKRAVLFGCNYTKPDGGQYALSGCINDVHSMAGYFKSIGYTDVETIVDDGSTYKIPDRATILSELSVRVNASKAGDTIFVHYSGHGGQTFDTSGDEVSGEDETIYGSGREHLEEIVDDELRATLIDASKSGVKIRAVFDSCHSASVLDLPSRCITDSTFVQESAMCRGSQDCLELSGCMDDQTSADAYIGGRHCGALTWAFLEAVRPKSNMTWYQLLVRVRELLSSKKYSQIPQLSVGWQAIAHEPIDL